MMKENKIEDHLKINLFSPNTDVVMDALIQIKSVGNSLYIPILFDLLLTTSEHEIETEIKNILGNVKDKQTVNSFMRGIEDEKYKSIRKTIISACWHNGLDFSTFLPVFIDQIINEDWETAFEAFTVADNLEVLPGEPVLSLSIQKIENAPGSLSDQKKYFLNEILIKLKE